LCYGLTNANLLAREFVWKLHQQFLYGRMHWNTMGKRRSRIFKHRLLEFDSGRHKLHFGGATSYMLSRNYEWKLYSYKLYPWLFPTMGWYHLERYRHYRLSGLNGELSIFAMCERNEKLYQWIT
jgi:hypothetical protein